MTLLGWAAVCWAGLLVVGVGLCGRLAAYRVRREEAEMRALVERYGPGGGDGR